MNYITSVHSIQLADVTSSTFTLDSSDVIIPNTTPVVSCQPCHGDLNSAFSNDLSRIPNSSTETNSRKRASTHALNVMERYVVPAVCVLGILLNTLNLLVLKEPKLRQSPFTYLYAMALLCVVSLSGSLVTYCCMHLQPNGYFCNIYTFYIYYPCVNVCSNSITWITTLLTIERFLFVKCPLWAKVKCHQQAAKIKIYVLITLMISLNIPRFMQYEVLKHGTGCSDPPCYKYQQTEFMKSLAYVIISWFYSAVLQIIPMVILCSANIYLISAVHRAQKIRHRAQIRSNMEETWSREQTRLTVTLISIVFFFIVCIMPSAFADLHVAFALFGGNMTQVSNLLVFCQLTFNFVLYNLFNAKFLAVLRSLLCRCTDRSPHRRTAHSHLTDKTTSGKGKRTSAFLLSVIRGGRNHKVGNDGNCIAEHEKRVNQKTLFPNKKRNGHFNLTSNGSVSSSSGRETTMTKIGVVESTTL